MLDEVLWGSSHCRKSLFGEVMLAGDALWGSSRCWKSLFGEVLLADDALWGSSRCRKSPFGEVFLADDALWGSSRCRVILSGKFSSLKKRFGVFVADGRLGVFVVEQEVWGLAEEEIRGNTVGKRIGGMGGGYQKALSAAQRL